MPAAKTARTAAAGDAGKQPTPQEAYLFFSIIKNMKGKPEVDWAAVAADSGFKNAETAKVRYGQIKRKLGLDTWNLGKGKDTKDDDAEGDGPKTPASGRGKKAAATPSTAGTGAGVKKRGSASKHSTAAASGGSRARKAKSEALVKLEDLNHDDDDDDGEEDEVMLPETPTKKGGSSANRVKSEFGTKSANNRSMATGIDYTNFPAVLPELVLKRQAICVNLNGAWTLSPVSVEAHAQWLAGLPAIIQTQFYTQVTAAGGKNGHSNFIDEDDEEGAAGAQLLGEQFNGAVSVPAGGALPGAGMNMNANMPMGMGMGMGYAGAAAPNAGGHHHAQTGKVGLHSIPMHPSYMAQMEQDLREQEERDHATLFGAQNGF